MSRCTRIALAALLLVLAAPAAARAQGAPIDYAALQDETVKALQMLPGVPVATPLAAGATDRPTYAQAGIQAYGLEPWLVEITDEMSEVHGNNERLSVKNIGFGLTLMIGVIEAVQ